MKTRKRGWGISALAAVCALAAGLATTPPARASGRVAVQDRVDARDGTCRGERATHVITEPGDHGSASDDVMVVVGAGLEVFANGGDDLVCVYGAPVDDYGHGSTIFGGPGNDTVITYTGGNDIRGDDGDDLIYLNGDVLETAEGGHGHDHIWMLGALGASADGNSGNDLLVGGAYPDFIHGGDDNDVVLGNGGDDALSGDGGEDELRGGHGLDDLDGGTAADECIDDVGGAVYSGCDVVTVTPNPDVPVASS
jgi:Ca2+-binding RTX toxin-like protein